MDFNIKKNWYDSKCPLYKKSKITINPGITVLVGKNGIGKTTLLMQIEQSLKKQKIPYLTYNELTDGRWSMQRALDAQNMQFLATLYQSSEGQKIHLNLGQFAEKVGRFISKYRNETVFVLFDAIDSGLSIDNIAEVKDFFDLVVKDNPNVYIIVSANSYEMANGSSCFDVQKCEYCTFTDYNDYRTFILTQKELNNGRHRESRN